MKVFLMLVFLFLVPKFSFAITPQVFHQTYLLTSEGNAGEAKAYLIQALPYETQEGLCLAEAFVSWIASTPSSTTRHAMTESFNAASFYLLSRDRREAAKLLIEDFEEPKLEAIPFIEGLFDWMEKILFSKEEIFSILKEHFLVAAKVHATENDIPIVPCGGRVTVIGGIDNEGNKKVEGKIVHENKDKSFSWGATGKITQDKDGNVKGEVEAKAEWEF